MKITAALVALLAASAQANWISGFQIDAAQSAASSAIQTYDAGSLSWGGNITIADNGAAATTVIDDSDGDVFFKVSAGTGYCIIDSAVNLNTEVNMVQVFEQNGLVCTVTQQGKTKESGNDSTAKFTIATQASHVGDCKWTGIACGSEI
jgi:hypothetical protein